MKNTTYTERDEFAVLTAKKSNGETLQCAIPIIALPKMNRMLTSCDLPRFEEWSDKDDLPMLFRMTHLCYMLHTVDALLKIADRIDEATVNSVILAMNTLYKELPHKGIPVSKEADGFRPYQDFSILLHKILRTSYSSFLPAILIHIPENQPMTPEELIAALVKDFHNSYRDFTVV